MILVSLTLTGFQLPGGGFFIAPWGEASWQSDSRIQLNGITHGIEKCLGTTEISGTTCSTNAITLESGELISK